eukprot:scaffold9945_cov182-Amphora_coffeaeformis.AAC.6
MKFLFASLVLGLHSKATRAFHCTHGRLFVSDSSTSTITPFEVDGLDSPVAMPALEMPGAPGKFLFKSATGRVVTSVARGTETNRYQDGAVGFIDTGVVSTPHDVAGFPVEKTSPTKAGDFFINCTRPIHYVNNDQKIGIFCDGYFDPAGTDTIPSQVYVLDEYQIGRDDNPVLYQDTLSQSHHGITVPVDDGHVLTSVATPERVAGISDSAKLPDGFHVINYQGNEIHGLNQAADPTKSCIGFHGSAHVREDHFFACNQEHGGLLAVSYGTNPMYTSRSLTYPNGFETHRATFLKDHAKSAYVLGNLDDSANGDFALVAFHTEDDSLIPRDQVLDLEASQCGFDFEQADGNFVLVLTSTGRLQVYTLEPMWYLVADILVANGMNDCSGTVMAPGYGSAYIVHGGKLYHVHLEDLTAITVTETDLEFATATSAVVAGVPPGSACAGPELPTIPAVNSQTALGWIILHHEPEDITTPGSNEQKKDILGLRHDISVSLGVGINRVFVGEIVLVNDEHVGDTTNEHDHDPEDKGYAFKIIFSDPSPADANQASSSNLLSSFAELVDDPDSALYSGDESSRIVSAVMNESPNHDDDGNASRLVDNDDDKLSSGAVGAIIAAFLIAFVVFVIAAYLYMKNRNLTALLTEAHKNPSEDVEWKGNEHAA